MDWPTGMQGKLAEIGDGGIGGVGGMGYGGHGVVEELVKDGGMDTY